MYLKHILWEAIGKPPGLQDGQEDLESAVTGCGVDKMLNCGDFPGDANVGTFSCCNFRTLVPGMSCVHLIHEFPFHDKEPITHISESVGPFVGWKIRAVCLCLESESSCCYNLTLLNRSCFEKLIFFFSSQ